MQCVYFSKKWNSEFATSCIFFQPEIFLFTFQDKMEIQAFEEKDQSETAKEQGTF